MSKQLAKLLSFKGIKEFIVGQKQETEEVNKVRYKCFLRVLEFLGEVG